MPIVIRISAVIALICIFMFAHDAGGSGQRAATVRKAEVTIVPADPSLAERTYRIVLLCTDDEAKTRGLQGFRRLERGEAALFVFDPPRKVTFWMGSVAFPIDIIFIGEDRRVVRMYSDRKPGSPEYYPSGHEVKWVLETAAGSGIRAGDTVKIR